MRGIGALDPEQYRALLDAAKAEKESAEGALAAASAEYARERELGRVGLAEVQRALPQAAALLSYVLYREMDLSRPARPVPGATVAPAPSAPAPTYAALVLRAGKQPAVVRLGAAADIDALVARWKSEAAQGALSVRRGAEAAEAAYRDAGAALRRAIWDPVERALAGADLVFVVPDGSLNLVALAALPTAERGYLVESGPVLHYFSAERDLAAATSGSSRAGTGLLALGGPDYDDSAAPAAATGTGGTRTRGGCSDFESMRFEPLPEAAREAEEIAAPPS